MKHPSRRERREATRHATAIAPVAPAGGGDAASPAARPGRGPQVPGPRVEPPLQGSWRPSLLHAPVWLRLDGDRLVREHRARRDDYELGAVSEVRVWTVDAGGLLAAVRAGRLVALVVVGGRRQRLSGDRVGGWRSGGRDRDAELAELVATLARRRAALGGGCRFLVGDPFDGQLARASAFVSLGIAGLVIAGFAYRWIRFRELDVARSWPVALAAIPLWLRWRHHARERAVREMGVEEFLALPQLEAARRDASGRAAGA